MIHIQSNASADSKFCFYLDIELLLFLINQSVSFYAREILPACMSIYHMGT